MGNIRFWLFGTACSISSLSGCATAPPCSYQAPADLVASPVEDRLTVFGLALTQPFTLSECPKDQFGYKIDSNNCFQRDRYLDDLSACMAPNNREIDVNFSFDNGPRIVAGRNARAQILDGKLEGVMFNTLGIVNQSQVLEQLTTKYGKPATVMNPEGQNAYGARFTSIYATWIFPNLDVTFNSALGRTDQGLVEIRTKKGTVAHQKLLDSFTKDKRPL